MTRSMSDKVTDASARLLQEGKLKSLDSLRSEVRDAALWRQAGRRFRTKS